MNRQHICDMLAARGLWYELMEHPAVYNMADVAQYPLPYPSADAKNLFLRDDKKQQYYLVTVAGDKRVDLKALRHACGARPLSFASPEELLALLRLTPGAVTPFGLLHDDAHRVTWLLDSQLTAGDGLIGVHPNDNTATLFLRTEALVALLQDHGCRVMTVCL